MKKQNKHDLLNDPKSNKGTAFTQQERGKLSLLGRLPYKIETLSQQVKRTYNQFQSYKDTKQKSIFLQELYNNNQTLFYKFVSENLEEILPIIYTPGVAQTCSSFSQEFRRPYGTYISYPDRKNLKKIIDNIITDNIEIIVVTDGERILGIGDQGVGGSGIPIGKLMLYTILGGIDPKKTLPIVLDVGTNNKELMKDPLYLGWQHPRITGNKYDKFIDAFVKMLKRKAPNVLLQWEDFANHNAYKLLDRYRKKICSFNDDIQGTAAVTLATILAATKTTKLKLSEQSIVIFGAGSSAIGFVKLLTSYLKKQGIKESEVKKNIWLVGRNGLITDQIENIRPTQKPYLHKINGLKKWRIKNQKHISLFEIIQNVKPTILIGSSTIAKSFNKKIIKEMARHTKHPIIMPLSNPTANSEATPKDLIKWTDGKALVATGSPFGDVTYKNKKFKIAQCNNALIFPGVGLGVIASKATMVTDEMFLTAVETLYKKSPALKNINAPLLPSVKEMPKISKIIAKKIVEMKSKNKSTKKIIDKIIWQPKYSLE